MAMLLRDRHRSWNILEYIFNTDSLSPLYAFISYMDTRECSNSKNITVQESLFNPDIGITHIWTILNGQSAGWHCYAVGDHRCDVAIPVSREERLRFVLHLSWNSFGTNACWKINNGRVAISSIFTRRVHVVRLQSGSWQSEYLRSQLRLGSAWSQRRLFFGSSWANESRIVVSTLENLSRTAPNVSVRQSFWLLWALLTKSAAMVYHKCSQPTRYPVFEKRSHIPPLSPLQHEFALLFRVSHSHTTFFIQTTTFQYTFVDA